MGLCYLLLSLQREIEAQGALETEPWTQQLSFCLLLCTDTAQLGRCVCTGGFVEVYVGSSKEGQAYSQRPLLSMVPNTLSTPAGSELPVCASCGQRIYDGQYLQALNADWHADCFR